MSNLRGRLARLERSPTPAPVTRTLDWGAFMMGIFRWSDGTPVEVAGEAERADPIGARVAAEQVRAEEARAMREGLSSFPPEGSSDER